MKNKKAIAMSFDMIFVIIVGAAILFLAIYAAVNALFFGGYSGNTAAAAQLVSYLDPLETGIASGETYPIDFGRNSKIYFDSCSVTQNKPFGRQTISFTDKSITNNFGPKSESVAINNKYVFAEDVVEGKKMYVFSKPFFMGYKVSDLIVVYSKKYCFYQAPEEITSQIGENGLNLENINFTDDIDNCIGTKVCFDITNPKCDIIVTGECVGNCKSPYDFGKVTKKNEDGDKVEMDYVGSLMMGAIFSSQDIYECNVKRLMNKFIELGKIYLEKIKYIELAGCSTNLRGRLEVSMDSAAKVNSSKDLVSFSNEIGDLGLINEASNSGCRLFDGE